MNSRWRLFAAMSLISQIARVPILLSFTSDVKNLTAYFIISATAIPIQFIALEILQYRYRGYRISSVEYYGIPFLAVVSTVYVFFQYGTSIGQMFVVFALGLLAYGAAMGRARSLFGANHLLTMEALFNGFATISVAVATILWAGAGAGKVAAACQGAAGFVTACLVICYCQLRGASRRSPGWANGDRVETGKAAAPLALSALIVTTQLERFIIASYQPLYLACIALAAGLAQAWRKLMIDDAVVFDRLSQSIGPGLSKTLIQQLRKARWYFYPGAFILALSVHGSEALHAVLTDFGILQGLPPKGVDLTLRIASIYFCTLPSGVVAINALRLRALPLQRQGWIGLILVGSVEVGILMAPIHIPYLEIGIAVISLTASLNIILLYAIMPINNKRKIESIIPDILAFALVFWGISIV